MVSPLWSQDSKIGCISRMELMEETDFWCVDTNLGKLKVTLIFIGWAC